MTVDSVGETVGLVVDGGFVGVCTGTGVVLCGSLVIPFEDFGCFFFIVSPLPPLLLFFAFFDPIIPPFPLSATASARETRSKTASFIVNRFREEIVMMGIQGRKIMSPVSRTI